MLKDRKAKILSQKERRQVKANARRQRKELRAKHENAPEDWKVIEAVKRMLVRATRQPRTDWRIDV
jgi:hypothetical protein